MKILFVLNLMFFCSFPCFSQVSFIVKDVIGPDIDAISDIQYSHEKYYCLSTHFEPQHPWRTYSQLLLLDSFGELIYQTVLGDFGYQYYQIQSIANDTLTLVGSYDADTSQTLVLVSYFILSEHRLIHANQFTLPTHNEIISIRLVQGLDSIMFLRGLYRNDALFRTAFIMAMNPKHEISLVFDTLGFDQHFTIDFNKNGYLIKDTYSCEFYDRNFTYRKRRDNYLDGYASDENTTHYPFGGNFILDQVAKYDDAGTGQAIRLIDSNFHIRHQVVIAPPDGQSGSVDFPQYGGMDITNENSIWVTSNYGWLWYNRYDFFNVTRLDSDLTIICSQFIGYDATYRIYGITALEENGAIVYGWRLPNGLDQDSGGEDVYAIKIGPDCELPTSLPGQVQGLFAISVYPNPTINSLTFDVRGFDPTALRVEIFNAAGITLFTQKDLSYEIHVTDFPAGQYFYRILKGAQVLGTGAWVKE